MATHFPRSIDTYHTLDEITALWRQFNSERAEWTTQQHEEWHIFMYRQCLARERRYEGKSFWECLEHTASTLIKFSFAWPAILPFLDSIYNVTMWVRDRMYEFVCPRLRDNPTSRFLRRRGGGGALFGLVWLVLSACVLVMAIGR